MAVLYVLAGVTTGTLTLWAAWLIAELAPS